MEEGLAGERETTMRPGDEDHGDHVEEGEGTRRRERGRERERNKKNENHNIHNTGGIS